MTASIQIFACQNRTCRRDGSAAVLAALSEQIERQQLVEQVEIVAAGCLGQCGNGPMLLVYQTATREEVWYDRVQAQEVPVVVQQHLREGRPVTEMLYRGKHPKRLPPPWHQ